MKLLWVELVDRSSAIEYTWKLLVSRANAIQSDQNVWQQPWITLNTLSVTVNTQTIQRQNFHSMGILVRLHIIWNIFGFYILDFGRYPGYIMLHKCSSKIFDRLQHIMSVTLTEEVLVHFWCADIALLDLSGASVGSSTNYVRHDHTNILLRSQVSPILLGTEVFLWEPLWAFRTSAETFPDISTALAASYMYTKVLHLV